MYPSSKIYLGDCICKDDHIGETECNVITCWGGGGKHLTQLNTNNLINAWFRNSTTHQKQFELVYSFDWFIVANKRSQKKLEATYFALRRPKLNDQV